MNNLHKNSLVGPKSDAWEGEGCSRKPSPSLSPPSMPFVRFHELGSSFLLHFDLDAPFKASKILIKSETLKVHIFCPSVEWVHSVSDHANWTLVYFIRRVTMKTWDMLHAKAIKTSRWREADLKNCCGCMSTECPFKARTCTRIASSPHNKVIRTKVQS